MDLELKLIRDELEQLDDNFVESAEEYSEDISEN